MKWKRKIKRKDVPRHRCRKCGEKLLYKESYGIWICDNCGREYKER